MINENQYFQYLEDRGFFSSMQETKEMGSTNAIDIEAEINSTLAEMTVDYVALRSLNCNDPEVLKKLLRRVLIAGSMF